MEKDGKRIQSRSKARETFCLPYLQCTLLGLAILAFSTPLVTLVSMDRVFPFYAFEKAMLSVTL